MFAKLLKRKESRQQMVGGGGGQVNQEQQQQQPQQQRQQQQKEAQLQYRYQRPDLLGKISESESATNSSHETRQIVVPKVALPIENGMGYAETINAGKSRYNEDQASVFLGELWPKSEGISNPIPYLYVGLFDGHGGPGCAVKASKELQQIVHEGLDDALDFIVSAHNSEVIAKAKNGLVNNNSGNRLPREFIEDKLEILESNDDDEIDDDKNVRMSLDELIAGALESAFWAMDRLILKDKEAGFRISGGSCAMVALFIFDRLFVANAGDCRACLFEPSLTNLVPMSFDFTPETDRQRIQLIAFQRPDLLRHPVTKEKLYNRHMLSRKVKQEEVGQGTVMYRDFYMAGWSCRDITMDDVRLVPLISGRGKLCRLLGTVGVSRGLGDHDLIVKSSMVNCKEFLTCQPEVRVRRLDQTSPESMLVMGSDGLWDVMSNKNVHDLISDNLKDLNCQALARELVLGARGNLVPQEMYWEKKDGDLASGDDITAIVIKLDNVKKTLKRHQQLQ